MCVYVLWGCTNDDDEEEDSEASALQEKGVPNKAAHFSANVKDNMCIYINELTRWK